MSLKYKYVAFIPVRGGSKSIPLKNIQILNGKPLIYWVLHAANECEYIDKIYVATDSDEIKLTVEQLHFEKVFVIGRSHESASDSASTESAMLEFASQYDFENIVLIQATSPLLEADDLRRGIQTFGEQGTDSVLSVVRQKRFVWKTETDGYVKAVNYSVSCRPRRQEFDGYLVENGAFYITSRAALLKSGSRISGRIKVVEMPEESYFEMDEPGDWVVVENLMKLRKKNNIPQIKLFLTDCDGCLTDGGMYYSEYGDEMKRFNAKDGMGFRLLKERGILTGVLTGENAILNKRRADKLQLDFYEAGCTDKYAKVCEICENNHIAINEVAYVGDDINDLEVIRKVGLGCSVANGMECVKESAVYVSALSGGSGAVREIIDWILGRDKYEGKK